jgi:biotin carboxyl carrier protein
MTEYRVARGEQNTTVTLLADAGGVVQAKVGDLELTCQVEQLPDGRWAVSDTSGRHLYAVVPKGGHDWLMVHGVAQHHLQVHDARTDWLRGAAGGKAGGGGQIKASMPGRVVRLAVQVGDVVQPGGVVAVLEAMKMENDVKAPGGGVVSQIAVTVGQNVESQALILTLSPLPEATA